MPAEATGDGTRMSLSSSACPAARSRAAATGPRASSSCSSATVPSVVMSTLSGSTTPAVSSALESSAYIRLSNPSSPKRLPSWTSARRRPETVATVSSSQPDLRAVAGRDGQRALGLLGLAALARDLGRHVPSLDRSFGALRQVPLPEMDRPHPLPDRQIGGDFPEVLLDLRLDLGTRQRRLVVQLRDHRAGNLLARYRRGRRRRTALSRTGCPRRAPRPRRGRRSCRWRRRSRPSIARPGTDCPSRRTAPGHRCGTSRRERHRRWRPAFSQ